MIAVVVVVVVVVGSSSVSGRVTRCVLWILDKLTWETWIV